MKLRSTDKALWAGLLACCLAALACKDKTSDKEPPRPVPAEVSGLAAIPAQVRVVVGANVPAIADSWLVDRAVEQMFLRDPELKTRIEQLVTECHFDPAKDLRTLIIGLGKESEQDQAIMVATGKFVEAEVALCVGKSLAADGGTLNASIVDGRTFYHASRGTGPDNSAHSVWFTFGNPETLIVATSSEWLTLAVGKGDKVLSDKAMASWIEQANTKAGLWAAGLVDKRVGDDLVELSSGLVSSAPEGLFGHVQLADGIRFELAAVMRSAVDANSLSSLAKRQISVGALVLQRYGLGPLLTKLTVDVAGNTVYVRFSLSGEELEQILARVDTTTGGAQDPPSGSGSPSDSKAPDGKD